MNQALINQIDREIENARQSLAQDVIRLVNIKSVKGAPQPGAPFGYGPKKVLDTVLEMGKQEGFYPTDYQVGVVSLAMKDSQPDLGIWLHGDVVPEGEGWNFQPYHATEYKGCIVGRGATDNKGQLCAIFHLLKIFKDLEIPLRYNPALFVGSNEETGMEDVQAFLNQHTPPRLSLVPDSSFPVGYGGKGALHVSLRCKRPVEGLDITAGQPESPGKATARLYGKTIVTQSPPRHGANPDPKGNMITMLMERLLEEDLALPEDRLALAFFKALSLDIHGTDLGIDADPGPMSRLTLFCQRIDMVEGCPQLTVNIRYPAAITADEIVLQLQKAADKNGVEVANVRMGVLPYLLDKDWPVITRLNAIANEITGQDRAPYTLGGGTYAHRLPNALAFGMDGSLPPENFPKGRGSAHGLDECVSLDRLQRAMKIYARTLLALNEMEW